MRVYLCISYYILSMCFHITNDNNHYRYNNKTYRIDDIAWDQNPNNTFKKGDADISFRNYFKTVTLQEIECTWMF